jgi:phage/plasmid-associated DNA primase
VSLSKLFWAVQGAVEWNEIGLATPQSVLDEVQEHRDSSDVLLGFIPEVVNSYTFDPSSAPATRSSTPPEAVSGTAIYQAYLDWCAREMAKPMSKRALFEAISERLPDVEKIRRNSGMHFLNLVLNKPGAAVQLLSRDFQYEK